MYKLDNLDKQFLEERISQFSDQLNRFLKEELAEDKFRNLRLRNGLYDEKNAYMLRIAIPYGTLNSKQLRQLGIIADKYDKGYGHITTRQNIQFNWINLNDTVDLFKKLSLVGMSAIQTSGKVVRNITTDYLAGIGKDEITDPRPYAEIIRQWFTLHPEFSWMAGKLKIAISGFKVNQTALKFHDIGLQIVQNKNNEIGFKVYVGGGLGSQPAIGKKISSYLATDDLLSYIESILRVYNLKNRRDNPKKNRLKILVNTLGIRKFKQLVEDDWSHGKDSLKIDKDWIEKIRSDFALPIKPYLVKTIKEPQDSDYLIWKKNNIESGKIKNYYIVTVPLKKLGGAPGDISSREMNILADLADKFSLGEVRTTNKQNLVLPYVRKDSIYELYKVLKTAKLVIPHQNIIANVVCCPGEDYCSLAKTNSISITQEIQKRFFKLKQILNIGKLSLHVSGCENSCTHHHIADIGLLGLKKGGKSFYQIVLAGESQEKSTIGKKLGPAIEIAKVTDAVESIVGVYVKHRQHDEKFTKVFNRIGVEPFKEKVYEASGK